MIEYVALPALVVGFGGFVTAMVLTLATGARESIGFTPLVRWLIVGLLALLAVSSALMFLSEADLEGALGPAAEPYVAALEDNLDTLAPLLILATAFAAFSAQQYEEVMRSRRAHARSHELLMDIVDSAPAGILFLDPSGRITFANDTGRDVLGLVEDPTTATVVTPVWCAVGDEEQPGTLRGLVHNEPYDGLPAVVRWPSGLEVSLRVSGRPLLDARDSLGGVVVSFERPIA